MSCLSISIADGVVSAAGSLLKLIEHAEKQTVITKKMLNSVEFESVSKSMLSAHYTSNLLWVPSEDVGNPWGPGTTKRVAACMTARFLCLLSHHKMVNHLQRLDHPPTKG